MVHEVVLQIDEHQCGVLRIDLLLPRSENFDVRHVCEDSALDSHALRSPMKIGLFIPIGNNGLGRHAVADDMARGAAAIGHTAAHRGMTVGLFTAAPVATYWLVT